MITQDQLRIIMPNAGRRIMLFLDPLNAAMEEYEINTSLRAQAFLAQIGHESGQLRFVREIWGPTPAQSRYEFRADLGNAKPGDGFRYCGRGLIQITGRANYKACSLALYDNDSTLIQEPELLEQPLPASRSAGWFWKSHGCNELADGGESSFERLTRRINGGVNGLEDRLALFHRAEGVIT